MCLSTSHAAPPHLINSLCMHLQGTKPAILTSSKLAYLSPIMDNVSKVIAVIIYDTPNTPNTVGS